MLSRGCGWGALASFRIIRLVLDYFVPHSPHSLPILCDFGNDDTGSNPFMIWVTIALDVHGDALIRKLEIWASGDHDPDSPSNIMLRDPDRWISLLRVCEHCVKVHAASSYSASIIVMN